MAQLGDIGIADNRSDFDTGAAFKLAQRCDLDTVISPLAGWEVEIKSSNPYLVARGTGATDASAAFEQAYEVAQSGLDLLFGSGQAAYSIESAFGEYLVWWREGESQILRVVFVNELSVRTTLIARLVNELGEEAIIPVQQTPQPHRSLRYLRTSQITDDLFDAYRNLWLAFELLLSSRVPRQRGEREGDWLKRALSETSKDLPLSQVYNPEAEDVASAIHEDLYVDIRCELFHSKDGGTYLLPHSLLDRAKVANALGRLTKIVALIARDQIGIRLSTGGITSAGFDAMIRPAMSEYEILVSENDDPLSQDEVIDGPQYESAITLATRYASELSQPDLIYLLGAGAQADFAGLSSIVRFGMKRNDALIITCKLDTELSMDGVDQLDVLIGIRFRNQGTPRTYYES